MGEGQLYEQQALAERVTCSGMDLHRDANAALTLRPSRANTGVVVVRPKALDPIGDLALLGAGLDTCVRVERGWHALHQRLGSTILTRPQTSEWLGATP